MSNDQTTRALRRSGPSAWPFTSRHMATQFGSTTYSRSPSTTGVEQIPKSCGELPPCQRHRSSPVFSSRQATTPSLFSPPPQRNTLPAATTGVENVVVHTLRAQRTFLVVSSRIVPV